MTKNPHFLYGDYGTKEYESKNEIDFHIENIRNEPNIDIMVRFHFNNPHVYVCSEKGLKELVRLQPE